MVLVNYIDVQSLGVSEMIFLDILDQKRVLWGTAWYCWVPLGTGWYWGALGGGRHWLVLRVLEGSGGTVWYQRVLLRTIGYWGYWVVQGGTWGYYRVLGGTEGTME